VDRPAQFERYTVSESDAEALAAGEELSAAPEPETEAAVEGYQDALTYVQQTADFEIFRYDHMLVMVENSATGAGLGFHAACRYSLMSPASRARRWIWAAGTGKAMRSGSSSGARRFMPLPWWLRPVL